MAQILVNDVWYRSIESITLYESAFERILLQKESVLFPGFHSVPFKKTVCSESDSARADYALIDTEYGEWWIVEVEMSHHSFEGHVLPQVSALANAVYGEEEASYLKRQRRDLDEVRLCDMLKGEQPRVLVIVDRPRPNWIPFLEQCQAKLAVFEIFRSDLDRYVYRVNGFRPDRVSEVISRCWLEPSLPTLLRIASPGRLSLRPGSKVMIEYAGNQTEWTRIESRDCVWLVPCQPIPLAVGGEYELAKIEGERLRLMDLPAGPRGEGR